MTRIDLGLAAPVRVGRLTLHPAVREIVRDDGASEVVEPRVMQVFLALAEARGAIVRREDLTERCWEGRIVGEDAINRVLSRLRRVAEGIGAGSFRLETITKIGYRLQELPGTTEAPPPPIAAAAASPPAFPAPRPSRRALLAAGAAGGVALAGGGAWWSLHRDSLPRPAREAMERGIEAFRQLNPDGLTNAAAAFHEAAELAPGAAEPWGKLAVAYRNLYAIERGPEAAIDLQRARDAAAKALALDPANGDAQAALATLQPQFMHWLDYAAAITPVALRNADSPIIGLLYQDLLSNVGRIREINLSSRRLVAQDPRWFSLHMNIVLSSWCLGQLDDADATMERAFQRWPRVSTIWFTRQRLLAYSGRGAQALAMIEDVARRPTGIPDWDFDLAALESRALLTRSPADIDAATGPYLEHAHGSVGLASNAMQFFAAIGRLDEAFALAGAYFFNRGFTIGERMYSDEQGVYAKPRSRETWSFWLPPMAGFRADPRAAPLMRELGLVDYWRRSGHRPDIPVAGV